MTQNLKFQTWVHAHGARYFALILCVVSLASLLMSWIETPLSTYSDRHSANQLALALDQRVALIPLGILIVTFARIVIGVQTIGTFMPVLLALSILRVGLIQGSILLTIVLSSGVSLSFLLRQFKLLPMPRTASMVVVVVLLIQGYQALSVKLGFNTQSLFGSFPLVVLAWMVERMADTIDSQSMREGVMMVLGSLSVSLMCWAIFQIPILIFILNNFFEVHFIALGLLILLGTYTGLRLTEWWKYSVLSHQVPSPFVSEGGPRHDHSTPSQPDTSPPPPPQD